MGLRRRTAVLIALVVFGLAGAAVARSYVFVGDPSREDAGTAVGGELLAWDADESLVVFHQEGRIYVDRLVIDRSLHLAFPPLPRWRRSGDWFYVPAASTGMVSAGIAPSRIGCGCHDRPFSGVVHVFGEVAVEEVAFVAVQQRDGEWERHALDGRGFIISGVDAVVGQEIRLRLLNADGVLIGAGIAGQAGG